MADSTATGSATRRRGMAGLGVGLAGLAVWLAVHNLRLAALDGWIFWVPVSLWFLTLSVLCWWSALGGHETESRAAIRASWRGGWIVGALGLAIGFVGPLVITPKASLGPLLGILLTGPLGFVVGALGAGVVRVVQEPR